MHIESLRQIYAALAESREQIKQYEVIIAFEAPEEADMKAFYAEKAKAYLGSHLLYNALFEHLKDGSLPREDYLKLYDWALEDLFMSRMAKVYQGPIVFIGEGWSPSAKMLSRPSRFSALFDPENAHAPVESKTDLLERKLNLGRAFGEQTVEDTQKANELVAVTDSPRQYLAVELYEQELHTLLGSNGRSYRIDNGPVVQGNEGNGEMGSLLKRTDIVDFFKRARANHRLTDMSYAEIIYSLYWSATPAPAQEMWKYFELARKLKSGLFPKAFVLCGYFILSAMMGHERPDLQKAIEIMNIAKEREDLSLLGLIRLHNACLKLILATPDELLSKQGNLLFGLEEEQVVFCQAQENPVEQEIQEQLEEMARLRLAVNEKIKKPIAERWAAEERVRQQEAKVQAECRQKAEMACQKAEEILKEVLVAQSQRRKAENFLNKAKKYDETYGQVDYLLGKLAYHFYLDAYSNPRKDASVAADIVREHLSLAIILSSEPSGFQCVVETRLLWMTLEIMEGDLNSAKAQHRALVGLNRSADYTESQMDRLRKLEDELFPEAQQAKEEALIKKREAEDAKKKIARFLKKIVQKKIATEKAKQEREVKILRKAKELGVTPLTDASRPYVLAKVYEQEFIALPVGHHTREMLISGILSEYAHAIQLDPDYHEAFYARAVFRQKNDPDQSGIEDAFERLRAIEAYKIKATFALGKHAQQKDNISEAIRLYESVVSAKEEGNSQENFDCIRSAREASQEIKEALLEKFKKIESKSKAKLFKNKITMLQECEDLIQIWPGFHEARLFLAEQYLNDLLIQAEQESSDPVASASQREKVLAHFHYLQTHASKNFRVYYGLWRFYCYLDASRSLVTGPSEQGEITNPWSEVVENAELMLDNSPSGICLEEAILFFNKHNEENIDQLNIFSKIMKNKEFENIRGDLQLAAFTCYGRLYEERNGQKATADLWLIWLEDKNIGLKMKERVQECLDTLYLKFYSAMQSCAANEFNKIQNIMSQQEKKVYLSSVRQSTWNPPAEPSKKEGGKEDGEARLQRVSYYTQVVFQVLAQKALGVGQLDICLMLHEKTLEVYNFRPIEIKSVTHLYYHLNMLYKYAQITHYLRPNVPKVKLLCERMLAFSKPKKYIDLVFGHSTEVEHQKAVKKIFFDAKNFHEKQIELSQEIGVLKSAEARLFYTRIAREAREQYEVIIRRLQESKNTFDHQFYHLAQDAYSRMIDCCDVGEVNYRNLSIYQIHLFREFSRFIYSVSRKSDAEQALALCEKSLEIYNFQSFSFKRGSELVMYVDLLTNCAGFRNILNPKDPKVLEYYQKILDVSRLENFEKLVSDNFTGDVDRGEVRRNINWANRCLALDAKGKTQLTSAVFECDRVRQVAKREFYGRMDNDAKVLIDTILRAPGTRQDVKMILLALYRDARTAYLLILSSPENVGNYRVLSLRQMRLFSELADLLNCTGKEAQALSCCEKALEVYDFQSFPFETGLELQVYMRVLRNCANIRFTLIGKDSKLLEYYKKISSVFDLESFEKLCFDHSMDEELRKDLMTVPADFAMDFLMIDAEGKYTCGVRKVGQVSQVTNNPSSMYGKQSPDQQALLSSQGSELSSLDEVASMKS